MLGHTKCANNYTLSKYVIFYKHFVSATIEPLLAGVTAIDHHRRTGHPTGFVGRQIDRGPRDVLWCADAADGMELEDVVVADSGRESFVGLRLHLLELLSIQLGRNPRRADRVHANFVLREINRHALHQQLLCGLRPVVTTLLRLT